MALHYITWHYITLHYFTLLYLTYITLHYITLHYITWHYISLHWITWHYMALHGITWHYMALHYITLLYLHYFTLLTLHHITLQNRCILSPKIWESVNKCGWPEIWAPSSPKRPLSKNGDSWVQHAGNWWKMLESSTCRKPPNPKQKVDIAEWFAVNQCKWVSQKTFFYFFSKAICRTEGSTRQQQYSHGWLSISFLGWQASIVLGFPLQGKGD